MRLPEACPGHGQGRRAPLSRRFERKLRQHQQPHGRPVVGPQGAPGGGLFSVRTGKGRQSAGSCPAARSGRRGRPQPVKRGPPDGGPEGFPMKKAFFPSHLSSRGPLFLKKFPKINLMVAGDLMVDEAVYGDTERISREAPVLILRYSHTDDLAPAVRGDEAGVAALRDIARQEPDVHPVRRVRRRGHGQRRRAGARRCPTAVDVATQRARAIRNLGFHLAQLEAAVLAGNLEVVDDLSAAVRPRVPARCPGES